MDALQIRADPRFISFVSRKPWPKLIRLVSATSNLLAIQLRNQLIKPEKY